MRVPIGTCANTQLYRTPVVVVHETWRINIVRCVAPSVFPVYILYYRYCTHNNMRVCRFRIFRFCHFHVFITIYLYIIWWRLYYFYYYYYYRSRCRARGPRRWYIARVHYYILLLCVGTYIGLYYTRDTRRINSCMYYYHHGDRMLWQM